MLPTIPRKKGDKLDVATPLLNYINNTYDAQTGQEAKPKLDEMNKLRLSAINGIDKNEGLSAEMINYASFFESALSRFPINETEIRFNFKWGNAYSPKHSATSFLGSYEYASTLFNLAALLSEVADLNNITTEAGLKEASKQYQAAAGVLAYLREYLGQHGQAAAVSTDLNTIDFLEQMMLGNSQFCVYQIGIIKGMASNTVALLALGAFSLYDSANKIGKTKKDKDFPQRLVTTCEVLATLCKAEAFQLNGNQLKVDLEYGLRVARCKSCVMLLENYAKNIKKVDVSDRLKEKITEYFNKAQRNFNEATSENDKIAYQTVPPENKLPELDKRIIAKCTPFVLPEKKPFDFIMPIHVKNANNKYRDERQVLLGSFSQDLENSAQELASLLQQLCLPAALETTGDGIPSVLTEKSQLIQSKNGMESLESNFALVKSLYQENVALYTASVKALDDEENESKAAMTKFGGMWTATPSHILNTNMRTEAAKFKNYLEAAEKSDGLVRSKIDSIQEKISLLEDPQRLASALPRAATTQDIAEVVPVRKCLQEIEQLVPQKEQLKQEIQTMASNDDIVAELIAAKNVDSVVQNALAKYQPFREQISTLLSAQQDLCQKLISVNENFVAAKKTENDPNAERRAKEISAFIFACDTYVSVEANQKEGSTFYTALQDQIRQFKGKCEDFALARKTERTELEQRLSSGGIGMQQQPQQQYYPGMQQQQMQPQMMQQPQMQQQQMQPQMMQQQPQMQQQRMQQQPQMMQQGMQGMQQVRVGNQIYMVPQGTQMTPQMINAMQSTNPNMQMMGMQPMQMTPQQMQQMQMGYNPYGFR